MKKITRTVTAVLLIVSCLFTIAPPAQAAYFTDVTRSSVGSETFDAINYMADNGYMAGTSTTHFSPTQNLTRAMFVAILYRYSGSAAKFLNSFTDVPSGTYYYYAVGWAAHYNIVAGVTTTQFAPNNYVTREQALAFLYRYATKYLGLTYSKTASITGHADYNSVSNYARTSVSWAKAYNILQLGTNSSPINPKSSINRATAALYFTRYSYFADKVYTRDKFSFANTGYDFASDSSMLISNAIQKRLYSCIDSYYGAGTPAALSNRDIVTEAISRKWNGSCAGMSLAVLLNKLGKIDFKGNFGNGAATMWNIASPKNNVSCESAINYYQVAYGVSGQSYPRFNATLNAAGTAIVDASQVINGANSFIGYLNSWGPTIFTYGFFEDGEHRGHAVIALSSTYDSATGRYNIKAIDPNQKGIATLTMRIIPNSGVVINGNIALKDLTYYSNSAINFWNNFDIDGEYNIFSNLKQIGAVDDIATVNADSVSDKSYDYEDTATLMMPYSNFTIVNAAGEILECNNGAFSGNIEVLEWWYVPTNGVSDLYVRVHTSDWFEYSTAGNADSYFFVTSPQYYGGADGIGIQSIQVGTGSIVEVDGSDMEYMLMASINQARDYYYTFRGFAESNIAVHESGDCLYTSGLSGQTSIQFYNYDAQKTVEHEIALNGQDTMIYLTAGQDSIIVDIPEGNQKITANWID